jgi:hypothetical protein
MELGLLKTRTAFHKQVRLRTWRNSNCFDPACLWQAGSKVETQPKWIEDDAERTGFGSAPDLSDGGEIDTFVGKVERLHNHASLLQNRNLFKFCPAPAQLSFAVLGIFLGIQHEKSAQDHSMTMTFAITLVRLAPEPP